MTICLLCKSQARDTTLIELGKKLYGDTEVFVCPVCDVPDREIKALNIIQIASRNYE